MPSDDAPLPQPLPQVDAEPSPQAFVAALRALRRWSGLTLEGLKLPTSTSHEYLKGSRLPTADWLDAFVLRCLQHGKTHRLLPLDFDVNAELNNWRRAWSHLEPLTRDEYVAAVAGRSTATEEPAEASQPDTGDTPDVEAESEGSSAGGRWRMLRNAAVAVAGTVAAFIGARIGANQPTASTPRPDVPSSSPQPEDSAPSTPPVSYRTYDSRTRYTGGSPSTPSTPPASQPSPRYKVWTYSDHVNRNRDT